MYIRVGGDGINGGFLPVTSVFPNAPASPFPNSYVTFTRPYERQLWFGFEHAIFRSTLAFAVLWIIKGFLKAKCSFKKKKPNKKNKHSFPAWHVLKYTVSSTFRHFFQLPYNRSLHINHQGKDWRFMFKIKKQKNPKKIAVASYSGVVLQKKKKKLYYVIIAKQCK